MSKLLLNTTLTESLKALRFIAKNESLLDFFIEKQVKNLGEIRKNNPQLKRNEAIKMAMLNAANAIYSEAKSEKIMLKSIQKNKSKPAMDWLIQHQAYINKLNTEGASLREVSQIVLLRFRKKISHSQIRIFLNKGDK